MDRIALGVFLLFSGAALILLAYGVVTPMAAFAIASPAVFVGAVVLALVYGIRLG